jgi:hypothetical protein
VFRQGAHVASPWTTTPRVILGIRSSIPWCSFLDRTKTLSAATRANASFFARRLGPTTVDYVVHLAWGALAFQGALILIRLPTWRSQEAQGVTKAHPGSGDRSCVGPRRRAGCDRIVGPTKRQHGGCGSDDHGGFAFARRFGWRAFAGRPCARRSTEARLSSEKARCSSCSTTRAAPGDTGLAVRQEGLTPARAYQSTPRSK